MRRARAKSHEWCGVKAGHEAIQVGRIPGRKSLALYYNHDKDGVRVLAWFRDEQDARLTERMLLKIARVER